MGIVKLAFRILGTVIAFILGALTAVIYMLSKNIITLEALKGLL